MSQLYNLTVQNLLAPVANIGSLSGGTAYFTNINSSGTTSALNAANANVGALTALQANVAQANVQALQAQTAVFNTVTTVMGNTQNLTVGTGNVTVLNAQQANVQNLTGQTASFTTITSTGNTGSLTAAVGNLTAINAQQASIQTLTGQTASFTTITSTGNTGSLTAAVGNLTAINAQQANIQSLVGQTASFTTITSTGNTGSLTAAVGNLTAINSQQANIVVLNAQTSTLGNVVGPLNVLGDIILTGNLRQTLFGNTPGGGYPNYVFGNLAASNIAVSTMFTVPTANIGTLTVGNLVGYVAGGGGGAAQNLYSISGNSIAYSYGNVSSFVGGTVQLTGNINAAGGTISGSMVVGAKTQATYPITLSTTVGAYTQICNITDPQSAATYMIRVGLVQSRAYNAIVKTYNIPMSYTLLPGTWVRCLPEYSTGSANGNDFALDVTGYQNTGAVTLRVVRLSATTNPATGLTAYVRTVSDTGYPITLAYDGTTGTGATNSGLFLGSPIGVTTGNVGILTANAAYPLDVNGTGRFGGQVLIAGNVNATGASISGSVTIVGNVVTNGYTQIPANNQGDWIYTNYTPTGVADRYGIGQYTNGRMKMFASSFIPQSTVALSLAGTDTQGGGASFSDLLTASNTAVLVSRPLQVASNVVVQGGNQLCLSNTNTINFGYDVAGKEVNAGRVGYGTFSGGGGSLDVVGVGNVASQRRVQILDGLLVSNYTAGAGNGSIVAGTAQLSGNVNATAASISGQMTIAGSTVAGSISTSGTVSYTAVVPGDMAVRAYGGAGDRYGMGFYNGGTQRLFTSSAYGPATVNLSLASTDGGGSSSTLWTDLVTASQSSVLINRPLTVTGNVLTNGYTQIPPNNQGDWIYTNYTPTAGVVDRYGIGQYNNGKMKMFASSYIPFSAVSLSLSGSDTQGGSGSFTDLLTASNTAVLVSRPLQVASNVVVQGGNQLCLSNTNTINFGYDVAGKEVNAGRVGYGTFSGGGGSLDVVGVGNTAGQRRVQVLDGLVVSNYTAGAGNGSIQAGTAQLSGNVNAAAASITGTTVLGSATVDGSIGQTATIVNRVANVSFALPNQPTSFISSTGSTQAYVYTDFNYPNQTGVYPGGRQMVNDSNYSTDWRWSSKTPGAFGNPLVERFTIAGSGNIGINQTAPQFLLHAQPSSTDVPAINPDATNSVMVYEDCKGASLLSGTLTGVATYSQANAYIQLTPQQNSTDGGVNYSINPGTAFDVTAETYVGTSGTTWADGMAFYCYSSTSTPGCYGGATNGYTLLFDDYAQNSVSNPGFAYTVALYWNSTLLASQTPANFQIPLNAWNQVRVSFVRNVWKVWMGSTQVLNYQDTSRVLTGSGTNNMGFTGHCGGLNAYHWVRNIQISKHSQGPWRPAAGGNVPGIQYNGPVTIVGNVSTNGYTQIPPNNQGDWIYTNYTPNLGNPSDRYGIGQYNNGKMKMFASSYIPFSTVSLSLASTDTQAGGATFTDLVTASNTSVVVSRPLQVGNCASLSYMLKGLVSIPANATLDAQGGYQVVISYGQALPDVNYAITATITSTGNYTDWYTCSITNKTTTGATCNMARLTGPSTPGTVTNSQWGDAGLSVNWILLR